MDLNTQIELGANELERITVPKPEFHRLMANYHLLILADKQGADQYINQ